MQPAEETQEILTFIDWLGLSVRLQSEPIALDGYQWREYTPTNVWGKRRVLYTGDGDRVLTLLSEPRSRIIASNAGLLEIENEWLYHGLGPEGVLSVLLRSCFFEVLGISRLDMCADFVPTKPQSEIIEGLASGKYYVGGKRNGSGFWSTNYNERLNSQWTGRRIPHCTSWGHKTSSIKWKLYYKTKELLDDAGGTFFSKPYIIDHWRMHDFDVSNVWRLEVSMHHLNDYQLYGQPITLDYLAHHRLDLFLSMYDSRFNVKLNQNHRDKTNDAQVEFLPIHTSGNYVSRAPAKTLAEHSGRITLLRHLVSSLDDEHVLLDRPTRMGVFDHIRQVVRRDRLDNYFHAMTGQWLEEWIESVDLDATGGLPKGDDTASALHDEEKGSTAPQGLLEVPHKGKIPQMKPNTAFEEYDSNGDVIPRQQPAGTPIAWTPRPTQMYAIPLTYPRPPKWTQPIVDFEHRTD